MRRRSLLGLAPLLTALPALAHPPRQPDSAEAASLIDEIRVFRDKFAKTVAAKDSRILRSLYADAFTHTDGSGKIDNKDTRIATAMAGEPMIENAPASEVSYRVFAGPTVVVTGKSPILTFDFRWGAGYVTGRDGWLLAVSQATRL